MVEYLCHDVFLPGGVPDEAQTTQQSGNFCVFASSPGGMKMQIYKTSGCHMTNVW